MGSGKTSAVHHLAHTHNATLLELDATVLALQTPMVSSLERPFLACFTAALHMQPAVVCIKHIERLFPKTLDGPAATRIADFCNALNTMQLEHARVAVVATVVDTARLVPRVRQCFQDEIDMEMGSRMASQLLQEIDALRALRHQNASEHYVFVLAATNCVDAIDDAFLQPGRFEHVVHVGHPDAAGRRQILDLVRSKMPWDELVDVDDLVADTEGLSAAELVSVARMAAVLALANDEASVSMDHLRQALLTTLERYHATYAG
ncbi:hypothetical protein DYB32_005600 [Aphanomyces invadans]|uniref:ATPase AAA-type core domain-containing protein n=1 Tax=Aphanomyces invadans TaxID=157072 RepID=A0A418AU13_9STRA|nr:hypothetical protein DYB32_005600 [Aphanomyces invadans]